MTHSAQVVPLTPRQEQAQPSATHGHDRNKPYATEGQGSAQAKPIFRLRGTVRLVLSGFLDVQRSNTEAAVYQRIS